MLSIKCPNCGGTVQFDENHIATFCSFCGSHLPDMTEYVKKSADLEIEQKRHKMVIETLDKDIERQQIKNTGEQIKAKAYKTTSISKLIVLIPCIIAMLAFFLLLFKLASS